MLTPAEYMALPSALGRVHLVGVGGTGMSELAYYLISQGYSVSGCDLVDNAKTRDLRSMQIRVDIGHNASHVDHADTLVYTSALRPDNPDYLRARHLGRVILHRAQALEWISAGKRLLAVTGSNGKTTSSGMLVHALEILDSSPGFVIGGSRQLGRRRASAGSSDFFVIEADESDGSIQLYRPSVALITGIDTDHADFYGSEGKLSDAFVEFAERAENFVVLASDDPSTRQMVKAADLRSVVTFGQSVEANVRVADIHAGDRVSFLLEYSGFSRRVALRIPGAHNALNAAGAFAVLVRLGFEPDRISDGLESFDGMRRRLELRKVIRGVRLYDDMAAHPTKVRATLAAARTVAGSGRVIVVYEPHLYSRTVRFAAGIAHALEGLADRAFVVDIVGTREDPVEGVDGSVVMHHIRDADRVSYLADGGQAASLISSMAQAGDVVVVLSGAGDTLVSVVAEALEERRLDQQ